MDHILLLSYATTALVAFIYLCWAVYKDDDLNLIGKVLIFIIIVVCAIVWPAYLLLELILWVIRKWKR